MRMTPIISAVLAVVVGSTAPASGQGVGSGSPTHTIHTLKHLFSIPENPISWKGQVGTTDDPSAVSLDPAGPVWTKDFEPEGSIAPLANIILLEEHLLITGERAWTGWHMSIDTTEFEWYSQYLPFQFVLRANGSSVPGAQISLLPDRAARFTFPELAPGTVLEIGVKMSYTGTDPFTDAVQVRQYPIPEPMTVGFLSLSFLFTAGRRHTHARTASGRSWGQSAFSR